MDLSTYDWIGAAGKIGPDGRVLSPACGWTHPGGGPLEHGRKPDGKADFSKTLIQGESQKYLSFDGDYSSHDTPDGRSHFRESGVLEGDCLLCHMGGYRMDRRNIEISKRNYRWAATAGAGVGDIKGEIFRYGDLKAGPDHDAFRSGTWNFSKRPSVHYFWGNGNMFTKEGKLKGRLINRKVTSKSCLQCHEEIDARKSGTLYAAPYDVHLSSGFQCTDCHGLAGRTKTQRLKHQIAKGWSPEGTVRNNLDGVGMKTCVGCHLEGQYRPVRADMPKEAKNPTKVHKEKFPRGSFHFYLLHCSACHSTGQPAKGVYLQDNSIGGQSWYTADNLVRVNWQDRPVLPASEPWKPWMTRHERVKGDGERYIPSLSGTSQWFGEKLENGEIRPISLRYVRQAGRGLEGLTVAEVKNGKGEKVKERTVATERDILSMVRALSGIGFRNVVFVANRIYEVERGKVLSPEILPAVRGSVFPAYHKGAQWFGEKLESAQIRPIDRRYVLQAFRAQKVLTVVEIVNARGQKIKEPTIVTDMDILSMIKTLSGMGFKRVVFVADRIYEVQKGRLQKGKGISPETPLSVRGSSFPVYHNVLPVEKKKTYGAKGGPDGCLDCHGETSPFFTKMKVLNVGRFLKEDYPAPKEPNAGPQMLEWGIRNVPAYE